MDPVSALVVESMYSFIACPFYKGNWPTSPCLLHYNFGSKHQFPQGMGNRCMSLSFGWLGGKYTWIFLVEAGEDLGGLFCYHFNSLPPFYYHFAEQYLCLSLPGGMQGILF